MQEFIVPRVILDQSRLLYRDTNKVTVVVEGKSDKVFFKTMMGEQNISFYPVKGWENVRNIIDFAIANNYFETMGVIDRDYHVLLDDGVRENDQLSFTDQNDLEMMLFMSPSFTKFLTIAANETKLESIKAPRTPILAAASYIGALRALSLKNNYALYFDEYECKEYVDYKTFTWNVPKLVNGIIQRTTSRGMSVLVDKNSLLSAVNDFVRDNSAEYLCNGHDVMDILGIAMRKFFASADSKEYSEERLFEVLLQGYTFEDFQKSELYKKIRAWMIRIA